ncbi:MAG: GTP-binding protein, partial [Promethearchaeota archaeon]
FEYRLTFSAERDLNLVFLFVNGLGDEFTSIKPQLNNLRKEFLEFYSDSIKSRNFAIVTDILNPIIDIIHRNLKPKISIVGFSGVGKTTTTRLIKSEEIPMQHIPTITGKVATIKIGKLHFHLWDFAGQDQFKSLWENFIRGSDAVLLMTDSTLKNLEKSKYFFELVNKIVPYARLAVIANKQDLPKALKVKDIERIMGQKSYSFVAIDPNNRSKMIRIIADLLDMDPRVSPLLKPLFERDNLMDKVQIALEENNFKETVDLFEKISNICLELGDDSLAIEFQGKADKLRKVLK